MTRGVPSLELAIVSTHAASPSPRRRPPSHQRRGRLPRPGPTCSMLLRRRRRRLRQRSARAVADARHALYSRRRRLNAFSRYFHFNDWPVSVLSCNTISSPAPESHALSRPGRARFTPRMAASPRFRPIITRSAAREHFDARQISIAINFLDFSRYPTCHCYLQI